MESNTYCSRHCSEARSPGSTPVYATNLQYSPGTSTEWCADCLQLQPSLSSEESNDSRHAPKQNLGWLPGSTQLHNPDGVMTSWPISLHFVETNISDVRHTQASGSQEQKSND